MGGLPIDPSREHVNEDEQVCWRQRLLIVGWATNRKCGTLRPRPLSGANRKTFAQSELYRFWTHLRHKRLTNLREKLIKISAKMVSHG